MNSVEERMKYITTEERKEVIFWYAPDNWNVSLGSNGDKFIATIMAGFGGETYLSVCYSSPNYAEINEKMYKDLIIALDEAWAATEQKELSEMLPALLNLCQVANDKYNKMLWE